MKSQIRFEHQSQMSNDFNLKFPYGDREDLYRHNFPNSRERGVGDRN